MGQLALGLRENSHRLAFLGYDVHRLSVLVFSISTMFAGLAGGLQVIGNEAANYVLFDASLSATVVLNTYIGGVKVLLGPALGASLMTFFGYVVSDLTQSWLLYQGILFVIVMLFMPDGLAGLFGKLGLLRRQFGAAALLPMLLAASLAVLLLTGAGVFLVELLQRLFAQDYRAIARTNPLAPWPAVALFGMRWAPGAVLTWLVPFALLAAGAAAGQLARRWFAGLPERRANPAQPHRNETLQGTA